MRYVFFILSIGGVVFACQPLDPVFGKATAYFPPTELLRKGVVNKYYYHYNSEDGYEKSTDIRYHLYRLLPKDKLEIIVYNADFSPLERSVTYFRDGHQLIEQQEVFFRQDTLAVEVVENSFLDWEGDTARVVTVTNYGETAKETLLLRQTQTLDTMIEGQPAQVFFKERESLYEYTERDNRNFKAQIRDTYRPGLGLYARELSSAEGEVKMELVAQMSRKTFLKQRAAAPERVAYINPAHTMDNGAAFEICHPQSYIYDYYNGYPDGGYRGGKRALAKVFEEQLDRSLYRGVSGYLTYRFVINCEGEAGRFVTEEADLDFKRSEFPNPLVQRGFEIISGLSDWQPTVLRDKAVDAYFYITLKFRDGELIEILP